MWITISTPPFSSLEQFDAVQAEIGGQPEGQRAMYVATVDDTLRVVVIWESKSFADKFFTQTLGPALAKALGPEPMGRPDIIGMEVLRDHVRHAVA